jgi:ribA/ribD-fused uncharacterized protein
VRYRRKTAVPGGFHVLAAIPVDKTASGGVYRRMYYDRSSLEAAFNSNVSLQFLFFWGHRAAKDGRITASCLSQWWPASFNVDGLTYPTAEHWMMAGKARLFGDTETAERILEASDPKVVKQLGREVRGFDPAAWDLEKFNIVAEGSFQKFRRNAELADFLLGTGDAIIVEASPVDPVWGIGLAGHDPAASNPALWRGGNLLGFALMRARDRLRAA